jgi:hypothetical protein
MWKAWYKILLLHALPRSGLSIVEKQIKKYPIIPRQGLNNLSIYLALLPKPGKWYSILTNKNTDI